MSHPAENEPESLADYFERTKGEKQRSLKKLGHGQGAASDPNRRGSMSDPIQKRPRRFSRLPYSILNE